MSDNPVAILLYLGVAGYVLHLYLVDFRATRADNVTVSSSMPGASAMPASALIIGVCVALLILAVETSGEIVLGVASEQSEMAWYFLFASLAAGVIEEVIFRGYLVVSKRGRAALITSCVGFSFVFALIHGHLWSTENGLDFTFTTKGVFSTSILFINSLWFYLVRFGPWNPTQSIFPCMLAHACSNLGVFIIKWYQGFVV
ncbi:MAG: CPBP family intramembrane metalloprotease [Puniceicoccaceae bacterium MED-G31]|nr:MAG: CPBP family intramembrane metalloprotease [Puniceicoccaceae bacterium MED-G31]